MEITINIPSIDKLAKSIESLSKAIHIERPYDLLGKPPVAKLDIGTVSSSGSGFCSSSVYGK